MNGETRFKLEIEQLLWSCARERFRAARGRTFMVFQAERSRAVCRTSTQLILRAPSPAMNSVVFYDSAESAAEAAAVVEKLRPGVQLYAAPAYEYAKARECACRNAIAGAAKA